jgi:gluconate 2-dehydrogenase gamma chain
MRWTGLNTGLTRREFTVAGTLVGAVSIVGCRSGNRGDWDFLNERQASILSALCDQIIPADDFPSASQAGVVTYIDRQLARHYSAHQDVYRDSLVQADAISRQRLNCSLVEATVEKQHQVSLALEKDNRPFFDLLRQHTMEGYYGSPRHGGNRDAVSWRMLGLDEPPLRGRPQYDLRSTVPPRKDGRS